MHNLPVPFSWRPTSARPPALAASAAAVSVGWSGYAVSLLADMGAKLPTAISTAPFKCVERLGGGGRESASCVPNLRAAQSTGSYPFPPTTHAQVQLEGRVADLHGWCF